MAGLPTALRPHKDKIVYLGCALGGLFAAALKFEFMKIEDLQGIAAWAVIGISAFSLWIFHEGFIKMRVRRKIMPGQNIQPVGQPRMEDLVSVQPPSQPAIQPPMAKTQHTGIPQPPSGGEDIFAEFK